MGWWQNMTGQSHMRSAGRNMHKAALIELNDPNYQGVMDRNRDYFGRQFGLYQGDLQRRETAALLDAQTAEMQGRRAIAAGTAGTLGAMQGAGGSLQARFAAAARLNSGVNEALLGLSAQGARERMGIRTMSSELEARGRMGYDEMGLRAGNEEFNQLMEQALVRRRVAQEPYLYQAQIDMGRGQLNAGLLSAGMGMVGSIVGGALAGPAGAAGGGFLRSLFSGLGSGIGQSAGQQLANSQFGISYNPNRQYPGAPTAPPPTTPGYTWRPRG